jgi:hypothetical protein
MSYKNWRFCTQLGNKLDDPNIPDKGPFPGKELLQAIENLGFTKHDLFWNQYGWTLKLVE